MGLFGKFRQTARPTAPRAIAVEASPGVLCAPVAGRVIAMADVPDPVFSGEVLGKGCAVWPVDSVVYAPVAGVVTVAMGHAVGIEGDDGVEVLVHVGVDTVEMHGDGFEVFAKVGARVRAGQPLVRIDRAKIEAAGHPDCVVLAVSNSAELADIALAAGAGAVVEAGEPLVRVSA